VSFGVPGNIGIVDPSNALKKARFTCRAAEIPDSTIASIEVPYFGRKIKVAGERTFSDWSVTIMNDEDFVVRSMFEAWSNQLNKLEGNFRTNQLSAEQYKVDLYVTQFSKSGDTLRSYRFVGAFPTVISNISLGWDTQNAIEEFSVNFAYDYWLPEDEKLSSKTTNVTSYNNQARLVV
jgi:hypothetical protein